MLLGINGHKALKYWQGQMEPLLEINASGLLNHHSQDIHAGHRLGRVSSKAHFEPHQWHLLAPLPPALLFTTPTNCFQMQQCPDAAETCCLARRPFLYSCCGISYAPACFSLLHWFSCPSPCHFHCMYCLPISVVSGHHGPKQGTPALSCCVPLPGDVQHDTLGKLHLLPELQKGQQREAEV